MGIDDGLGSGGAGGRRLGPPPADPQVTRLRAFRSCVGRFPTGVTVVTYEGSRGPWGITVNSFASVSLDPLLVLVSVSRSARSHDLLIGRPFCVNILNSRQERLARYFSGGTTEVTVPWDAGAPVPRLAGALARLVCQPWQHHAAGDHTLMLGLVTDFDAGDGDALAYARSRFTEVVEPPLGVEYII